MQEEALKIRDKKEEKTIGKFLGRTEKEAPAGIKSTRLAETLTPTPDR